MVQSGEWFDQSGLQANVTIDIKMDVAMDVWLVMPWNLKCLLPLKGGRWTRHGLPIIIMHHYPGVCCESAVNIFVGSA